MIQTSTSVGTAGRKARSLPLRPDWLQTLRSWRAAGPKQVPKGETLKTLQRSALRELTSQHGTSGLGDYVAFGVADRTARRCMSELLRELRLDDMRVLALDSILTPALRQKHWLRKASVVRVGRDLRASADDVLRSVEPLIHDQTVFIFDCWKECEQACEEFLRAHPGLRARRLASDSTLAQGLVVTRALTV